MRRSRLLGVAALVVVSACGSSSDGDGAPVPTQRKDTALTIAVTPDRGASPMTYALSCDPAGGDHPQPEQACEAVERAGVDVFEPVPGDRACTEIYGGPQVATVAGTVDGDEVDATFTRANGCEIERWDALGTTFFDVPLQ